MGEGGGGGLKKHIRRPPLLRTKMPHHSPYIRTQQHPTKYSTNLIGVCVKGGRKQRQQKEQKLHCPTEGGRTGSQDKGGGEQQQRIGAQSVRRRGGGSLGHRKSSRRESQKVSSLTMGSPPPFFFGRRRRGGLDDTAPAPKRAVSGFSKSRFSLRYHTRR